MRIKIFKSISEVALYFCRSKFKRCGIKWSKWMYGVIAGFDMWAYSAKGDITSRVRILGVNIDYTYAGSFASAHARGKFDAHWNNQTVVFIYPVLNIQVLE